MPESLPLVSVITPTYNRASYLPETIESVLSQDYPNFEYIVLDDGSQDNTIEVLKQYDNRIIWESHPNMGETRTVNKGFSMAKGEFFVVVNSDDPILPGLLTKTVAMMQAQPELLVVYPDWITIDQDSNEIERLPTPDYDYLTMLRTHYCNPGGGAVIRRRAYELEGGRDPQFTYVGDYDYWLRVGLHGPFARLPEYLATFRVHPDSATQSAKGEKMGKEHVTMLKALFRRKDLPPEVRAIKAEAMSIGYLVAANIIFDSGAPEKARGYLLRSMLARPSYYLNLSLHERVTYARMALPPQVYHFLTWWARLFRPLRKRITGSNQ